MDIPAIGATFKVFVGNLSDSTTELDLRREFSSFGEIVEVCIMNHYGFVHFQSEEDAKNAIRYLNGEILNGKPMVVQAGHVRTKIFVRNVGRGSSVDDLIKLFEEFGTVVEADIITNFAFVHMSDPGQAQAAIRGLDGYRFNGRMISVEQSTNRENLNDESSKPRHSNTFKIFVGNISDKTQSSDLHELFADFGNIVEAEVIRDYGFVHMDNEVDGRNAIDKLNGVRLHGRALKVTESEKKAGKQITTKLFVVNIADSVGLQDLKDLFNQHGDVVEADLINDYAFVHMDTISQAEEAIKALDGYELNGMKLKVKASKTPGSGSRNKGGHNHSSCRGCECGRSNRNSGRHDDSRRRRFEPYSGGDRSGRRDYGPDYFNRPNNYGGGPPPFRNDRFYNEPPMYPPRYRGDMDNPYFPSFPPSRQNYGPPRRHPY